MLRRPGRKSIPSDVVGPICESGDYFCHDRPLPAMAEGEYLALLSAGAYGSVMASNYNSRPTAPEVLVNGSRAALVRPRQPLEQLWASEQIPGWLNGHSNGNHASARPRSKPKRRRSSHAG